MGDLRARLTARLADRSPRRSAATVLTAALLAVALTAGASGFTLYRIRSGDTLTAIAARYHTTVARLVALNHLPGNGNLIIAGKTLKVPRAAKAKPRYRTVTRVYVVRPGDSLYAVAAREHVSAATIARRNHLPRSLMIFIGQRLAIPHRVRVVATTPPHHSSGAHLFTGRSVPSREQVAAIIRATAKHWGVDQRLALAVAWQESGFNQRWVSATQAVGAMQVEPYTATFISTYIVRRHLDIYDARDNATAGVALLSVLLRETHGNKAKAVAGYYQGLASVQQHGMFASTKRYVANVLALRNRF
jgi:LysM repeat protein